MNIRRFDHVPSEGFGPQPLITPEIRMWALDFANNLVPANAPVGELLTLADRYANYVLTGEHFS